MLAPNQLNKRHWSLLLLLPVVSLFFIGGPDGLAMPWLRYAWNMGHIVFFAAATVVYSQFQPFKSTLQVFSYLAFVLVLSFFIEGVQRVIGRSMSAMDILRNLVGCALALWFVARAHLHISTISFLGFVLIVDLGGFAMAGYTDYLQQNRKPIIEDFESEFSVARWGGNLATSEKHVLQGRFSGRADFEPGNYATLMLTPTLLDWSGYRKLEMNLFNPTSAELSMTVRIHDQEHARSTTQAHNDRFNQSLVLTPGWNNFVFSIDDIIHAPKNRTMDVENMFALGIFFSQLQQYQTLYLDQFQLIDAMP